MQVRLKSSYSISDTLPLEIGFKKCKSSFSCYIIIYFLQGFTPVYFYIKYIFK